MISNVFLLSIQDSKKICQILFTIEVIAVGNITLERGWVGGGVVDL